MAVLIDANFLLSAVTQRNAQQRQISQALIRSAAQHHAPVAIPQCIVFEAIFVLSRIYAQTEGQIAEMMTDLVALAGVEVIHEIPVSQWLDLWPAKIPGPVDAAIASIALFNDWPVATFDATFAKRLRRVGGRTWQP